MMNCNVKLKIRDNSSVTSAGFESKILLRSELNTNNPYSLMLGHVSIREEVIHRFGSKPASKSSNYNTLPGLRPVKTQKFKFHGCLGRKYQRSTAESCFE